jgi:hypothetical protein
MNKLTAEKCRELLAERYRQRDSGDISIGGSFTLQALEIALPVLEQQGGWVSCSERLPPEREQVILWDADLDEHTSGHYSNQTCNFYCGGMIIDNEITHWQPAPTPPQAQSTTPQIDNDGWIEWGGGECPINPMAIVEVKFTLTPQGEGIANWWDWHHGEGENNILAYRVIENDGSEG